MTRTATLASSNQMIATLNRSQARVLALESQVSTEKRAQTYGGLSAEAAPLVRLETAHAALERSARNNAVIEVRLKAVSQAVSGLRDTVETFRNELIAVGNAKPLNAVHIADVQDAAFRGLKNMEALLNSEFNGQYLFGGGSTTVQPVRLGASTLAEFQSIYTGDDVVYPPTRDAHVATQARLTPSMTEELEFAAGPPATITAKAANAFQTLKEGATIEVSDGSSGNNRVFTVVRKTANNVIEVSGQLNAGSRQFSVDASVNPGTDKEAMIVVRNWYGGDTLTETHRLDADRSFTLAINAIDPGFEKAIRAMGLVAQGQVGGAGDLAANIERIEDALALVGAALDRGSDRISPYGEERPGTVVDAETRVGYHQVLLAEVDKTHTSMMALLEERVASLENVDKTDAIARLLDESTALEASYHAVARVRQLSLSQYL